jgi:hypothetical protein
VHMWTSELSPARAALPEHVADACIRVLGVRDSPTTALRARSRREMARHTAATQ